MSKRLSGSVLAFVLLLSQGPLHGANIAVSSLELMTRGFVQDGLFGFTSRGSFDLEIEGGVKFGGILALGFDSTNIEGEQANVGISFKSAGIRLRQLFTLPVDFAFFVGESDTFLSGQAFTALFGSAGITTRYRGFFYFPESIIYDGMHTVKGTGFGLTFPTTARRFLSTLYLYQDMRITRDVGGIQTFYPGHYSADLRALLNFEHLKIEAFAGATYPAPDSGFGYFRGGLLFYAGEANVEFMTQLGIPRIAPTVDTFSINLFYLLFEPRVHLGILHIIPTFFWHPQYYLQQNTGELGSFDVNLNFLLRPQRLAGFDGGIEANLVFQSQQASGTQQLSVKVSPYASFQTPGVLWDVKVNANVFPFDLTSLVDVFLGIRAEF